MEADVQSLEEGADIRVVSASLEAKGRHANEHLAAIKGNPTKKREATEYAQRLAALAKIQDQLVQNIEEQDQAAAEQPQPGEVTPEMAKVQGNLELKAQKQQGDAALKRQKTAADLALKAENQTADIRLRAIQTSADVALKRQAAEAQPAESEA
jgi:hypothetical protein